MKIINLQQNSPEWYEYRKIRIGASDFAVFACYKNLSQPIFKIDFNTHIYNKKNSINITNKYIKNGTEREPILLDNYNKKNKCNYMPTVIEHETNNQIFASLDGYSAFNDKVGLEIKTTSAKMSDFATKMQYYLFQLTHQMYVAELNYIDVVMECVDGIIEHRFSRIDMLISYEEWIVLCHEYLSILNTESDNDIIAMLNKYTILNTQIKELEAEKKIITDKLMLDNKIGVFDNYIISLVERKSYKYADYIKKNNIQLDDSYLSISKSIKITKKGADNE